MKSINVVGGHYTYLFPRLCVLFKHRYSTEHIGGKQYFRVISPTCVLLTIANSSMKNKIFHSIKQSNTLLQIYGYKFAYTVFYFLFQFFVVKMMSKAEFGHFSFYTSVVVYFGSFSLLGAIVYSRRQIAKGKTLAGSYLLVPLVNFFVGLGVVFFTVPKSPRIWGELVVILSVSVIMSIITTICNALEQYTEQYKMIVWMSIWNLACLVFLLLGHQFSVEFLLRLWAINALCILPVLFIRYRKVISQLKIEWDGWRYFFPSYLSLIFLYLVVFPFEFFRYFDKWLIKTTFSADFLGSYAFNILIVTSFVSLFIRPLEGILATELAKVQLGSITKLSKIISRHYLKITVLYAGLLFYIPLSNVILKVGGLTQYMSTVHIFLFIYAFYILYSFGAPLLMLLNYNGTKKHLSLFFVTNAILFVGVFLGTRFFLRPTAFLGLFLAYQVGNVLTLVRLVPNGSRIFGVSMQLVFRRLKNTIWIFDRKLLHIKPQ